MSHSKLSPSSASRWLTCPGSLYLSNKCPKPPTSVYAEEGTRAHSVAESMLKATLKRGESLCSVMAMGAEKADNDEMFQCTLDYHNFCLQRYMRHETKKVFLGIEAKILINKPLDIYGTGDFCFVYSGKGKERHGEILDYKHGRGVVVAADDPQLACYAVGLNEMHGPLYTCIVHIFQPRAEGDTIKTVTYVPKELKEWKSKILDGGRAALDMANGKDKPVFNASEEACRWCPAKAICLEYKAKLEKDAGLPVSVAKAPRLPAVETLPDEQIVRLIKHREEFKNYLFGAIDDYVLGRIMEGNGIEGLKAVYGRSIRQLDTKTFTEEQLVAKLKDGGVPEVYNQKLKGIGELEKQIGKKNFAALGITTKTEPKLKIALENDPGEAVTFNTQVELEDDFGVDDDEF